MNTLPTREGRPLLHQHSRQVAVRLVQPGDAPALYDLHRRLLPDSLYSRFQQYRTPTLAEMAAICTLAPEQGAGVVAVTTDGRAAVVGLAYYVRDGDGPAAQPPASAELGAEVAIVVADRCQGTGVGRALWQQLHRQAAARGLQELRVLFTPQNQRILRLITGSGYRYECSQAAAGAGDLNEYRILLAPQQERSRLHRLLTRATARII